MDTIHTLTALLQNSGCQYQIFDLGRRVQPIDSRQFAQVELGQQAYPFPVQRHAQFAIVYWNEQHQPWIWMLKFALDERGLLQQTDVGQFIQYLLEAMGSRLNQSLSEEQQQKLASNPYTFKPSEDKLAVLHSQIRAQLGLACSQYYEHAQHYFAGGLGWDKWHTIGLQGITDICARLEQEQNGVLIRSALTHLPAQPLYAVLGALEHVTLPEKLAERLSELADAEVKASDPDLFLLSALVRALAGAPTNILDATCDAILASPALCHQEVLIALAGRSWNCLQNTGRAQRFLVRLAQTQNQALFNQLFADVVMLPALRGVMLPLLHASPSPELAHALQQLQQMTRG